MLEIYCGVDQRVALYESGPGTQVLKSGSQDIGYFGEVAETELFTPGEISALFPELPQTPLGATSVFWLKFSYKGKYLFMPKKGFLGLLTYSDLYKAGLVYGTDNDGAFPLGAGANQIRVVEKDGYRFKVRMIRADTVDPTTALTWSQSSINDTVVRSSEYTDLLYKLFNGAITNYPEKWENFTLSDLISAGQSYEPVMETVGPTTGTTDWFMTHGFPYASRLGKTASNIYSTRLVLELLTGSETYSIARLTQTVDKSTIKSTGGVKISSDSSLKLFTDRNQINDGGLIVGNGTLANTVTGQALLIKESNVTAQSIVNNGNLKFSVA